MFHGGGWFSFLNPDVKKANITWPLIRRVLQYGKAYRVRVAITRRSFQVNVYDADQAPGSFPFWTTRAAPMDDLAEARLVFADVEPPGGSASSRWGPIRVWRPQAHPLVVMLMREAPEGGG